MWNLLSNAVKFTPAGGARKSKTRLDDGQIELTVTDSGIGIDATILLYVFDLFRQADASSTRAQGGLGLGRESFVTSLRFTEEACAPRATVVMREHDSS